MFVGMLDFHRGQETKITDQSIPGKMVHGANMGPIWGRQDPGGPHAGPMNFAICHVIITSHDARLLVSQGNIRL